MEQSEHKSANEALVIQAQGRQLGPYNVNQMKHSMQYQMQYSIRYSIRYHIRHGAENLRCVAQNI
jgi:hypothetical protein